MCVPLQVNGFSELDKLIPPQIITQLSFEKAKGSFFLVSNDGSKGDFKIEEMMIVAT